MTRATAVSPRGRRGTHAHSGTHGLHVVRHLLHVPDHHLPHVYVGPPALLLGRVAGLRNVEGWSRDWSRALGPAALVGCTGLRVHSFFDFNLQIPANTCVFYFLCAVATST